jgi:nucleoside-triphosphatase
MEQVYLLTGRPGSGKTSLIKQVVAKMGDRAGGFYTEEIRSGGTRLGFKLVTLDGQEEVLAHTTIHSPYRVSKYGVDINNLDRVGVNALSKAAQECPLVIIDEIGKMELFSANLREAVLKIINSGKKVLGTIMLTPHSWADLIKQKPQVKLIEVTRANHPQVLKELSSWLDADLGPS